MPALLLALTLCAQPDAPVYRYVPVPRVKPGSVLYAYWDHGPKVPIAADVFAYRDLQKFILAADQKGIDDLKAAGRLYNVTVGTGVRVLRYEDGALVELPSYEVRILDGTYEGKSGWVVAPWLRARVAAPPERPKRRRR